MIDLIILIPTLIQILIWLGIIGAAIWIWKNKKWSKSKKAAIILALAIGLLIGFYAIFAFILVSSDQANYLAQGSNLGQINYDEVISNAQKSGYRIDVPSGADSIQEIGVHPSNIRELDERFGKEYPALEKAINGVDCIEPSPNSSLCKAASTEDFRKIRNFIYSKLNSTVSSCFKFEKYDNCYIFSFARP